MAKITPNQARESGAQLAAIEIAGAARTLQLNAIDRATFHIAIVLPGPVQQTIAVLTVRRHGWPAVSKPEKAFPALIWSGGNIILDDDEADLIASWLDGWAGGGA